jgi:hypothetical protein
MDIPFDVLYESDLGMASGRTPPLPHRMLRSPVSRRLDLIRCSGLAITRAETVWTAGCYQPAAFAARSPGPDVEKLVVNEEETGSNLT